MEVVEGVPCPERPRVIICQVNGRLPAQCCGSGDGDSIFLCEEIAPPGHECRVGCHTQVHERWGNGYPCDAIEKFIREQTTPARRFTVIGF
jgi:hypothetical protein